MTTDQYHAKVNRRMQLFHKKHLRPVYNALQEQIKPVVATLIEHGAEAAIKSIDIIHINSALAPVVKDIHKDVALYFANKTFNHAFIVPINYRPGRHG